jgi:hypothetical protein
MSVKDESDSTREPIEVDVDSRVDEGYSADREVSADEAEDLEKERQERLDPANRPANAEIDNTQRDFNPETGEFEKSGEEVENGPVIGADRPEGVVSDVEPEDASGH